MPVELWPVRSSARWQNCLEGAPENQGFRRCGERNEIPQSPLPSSVSEPMSEWSAGGESGGGARHFLTWRRLNAHFHAPSGLLGEGKHGFVDWGEPGACIARNGPTRRVVADPGHHDAQSISASVT